MEESNKHRLLLKKDPSIGCQFYQAWHSFDMRSNVHGGNMGQAGRGFFISFLCHRLLADVHQDIWGSLFWNAKTVQISQFRHKTETVPDWSKFDLFNLQWQLFVSRTPKQSNVATSECESFECWSLKSAWTWVAKNDLSLALYGIINSNQSYQFLYSTCPPKINK